MAYTEGTTSYFANQDGGDLGILGNLLAFVCPDGTQFSETIGTGNGEEVEFGTVLSETGIALGQCGLWYRTQHYDEVVWLNSDDVFSGPGIDEGYLNRANGEIYVRFSEPVLNGYSLLVKYSTGNAGQDWIVLLQQNTKDDNGADAFPGELLQEVVLRNSGETGDDNVIIGIREWQLPTSSYWGWNLNTYQEPTRWIDSGRWNVNSTKSGAGTYNTTSNNYTVLPSIYFKDSDLTNFKFAASKARITGMVRVTNTYDYAFYCGNLLRVHAAGEYPNPAIASGTYFGNINYTSGSNRHFTYTSKSTLAIMPDGKYIVNSEDLKFFPEFKATTVTNFKATPGIDAIIMFPYTVVYGRAAVTVNSYEHAPLSEILGEMDGLYRIFDSTVSSGDVLVKDEVEHFVFQNGNSTGFSSYVALRKA